MHIERFSRFIQNTTLYHENGRGLEKYQIRGSFFNSSH